MGLGMLEGAFLDEHGQVGRTLYQHKSLSVSVSCLHIYVYIYVYEIYNIYKYTYVLHSCINMIV